MAFLRMVRCMLMQVAVCHDVMLQYVAHGYRVVLCGRIQGGGWLPMVTAGQSCNKLRFDQLATQPVRCDLTSDRSDLASDEGELP